MSDSQQLPIPRRYCQPPGHAATAQAEAIDRQRIIDDAKHAGRIEGRTIERTELRQLAAAMQRQEGTKANRPKRGKSKPKRNARLLRFAAEYLKGNQRRLLEFVCASTDPVPLGYLAARLDWAEPCDDSYQNAQSRLNAVLRKHKLRFHLERFGSAAHLKPGFAKLATKRRKRSLDSAARVPGQCPTAQRGGIFYEPKKTAGRSTRLPTDNRVLARATGRRGTNR